MYCTLCGSSESFRSICDKCLIEKDVDELVKCYLHRGYPYDAIVGLLEEQEGLYMCVRTLKRRLQSLVLRRKGNASRLDEEVVRTAIGKEMKRPGMLAGYRSIWHALRLRHGIHVPRGRVLRPRIVVREQLLRQSLWRKLFREREREREREGGRGREREALFA